MRIFTYIIVILLSLFFNLIIYVYLNIYKVSYGLIELDKYYSNYYEINNEYYTSINGIMNLLLSSKNKNKICLSELTYHDYNEIKDKEYKKDGKDYLKKITSFSHDIRILSQFSHGKIDKDKCYKKDDNLFQIINNQLIEYVNGKIISIREIKINEGNQIEITKKIDNINILLEKHLLEKIINKKGLPLIKIIKDV